MSDPLAILFDQLLKERVYLKAISPRTEVWYRTAFKAFRSSPGEGFSKQRLHAFVVVLRDRGVNPRSFRTRPRRFGMNCSCLVGAIGSVQRAIVICMPPRARARDRIRSQTALSVDPRTAKLSISRHH
jgi:hypothetical protein